MYQAQDPNKIMLAAEVTAWEKKRHTAFVQIDGQFKAEDARIKLKRLYPLTFIRNSC
jgi:hypothetical protein